VPAQHQFYFPLHKQNYYSKMYIYRTVIADEGDDFRPPFIIYKNSIVMTTSATRLKIRTLREDRGYSQSQMAEKLHMDECNYKRIESGEKKTLDLELLGRIAEVLETDVPDLLATELYIEHNGDNNGDYAHNGDGPVTELNINNNFPPELKKAYEDMMQLMRDLIAEKDKTIAMQQQMLDKK
jgi:transcriptional regulator with XRE-family HTH domain